MFVLYYLCVNDVVGITAHHFFRKDMRVAKHKNIRKLLRARQNRIKASTSSIDNYLFMYLKMFAGEDFDIEDIDTAFIAKFAKWLLDYRKMTPNSAKTYLHKLHALLVDAFYAGFIKAIPQVDTKRLLPKCETKEKEFLSVEELRKLEKTPCGNRVMKYSFLFSCYTGLRLSDIETLTWSDIKSHYGKNMVVKKQQKTDSVVKVPLCDKALEILDTILEKDLFDKETHRIFPLPSRTAIGLCLNNWVKRAGINKHISFHSARVTFATLNILAGTDISIVSRLCGHKNITTTMIYAKMTDQSYDVALDNMDNLFNK